MSKFLGIDYGTKRIGLAISDESGRLAFPKIVILNDSELFPKIDEILRQENISEMVLGYSTNSLGDKNKIQEKIDIFSNELHNKFNLPVHFQKEFFTSVESTKREGKEKNIARKIKKVFQRKDDSLAAALILQRYLDKINRN